MWIFFTGSQDSMSECSITGAPSFTAGCWLIWDAPWVHTACLTGCPGRREPARSEQCHYALFTPTGMDIPQLAPGVGVRREVQGTRMRSTCRARQRRAGWSSEALQPWVTTMGATGCSHAGVSQPRLRNGLRTGHGPGASGLSDGLLQPLCLDAGQAHSLRGGTIP